VILETHELSPREQALHNWGRMATLDEWITYIRRVMEKDDDFEADVVCAACRQLEGPGKEGS